MKRMSFAKTREQFLDGSKTVTRRVGWWDLKAGDRLLAVSKVMGMRKGEKAEIWDEIEIVSVRKERLDYVTQADVIAEGFPLWTPVRFLSFFCLEMRCEPSEIVNRIEFKRLYATV